MIKREHYLNMIRGFYDSDLIKIITGIRRSGKSIILKQISEELKEKSNNIIYINFEDKRVATNIKNANDLIDYIDKNKKNGTAYLLFDEVQLLDGWQDACKTLRLYGNSIFITGSNSKLLSSEFTKELSGRYVSFRVRPFVYKEILELEKELGKNFSIEDYLIWGGFPNRFSFKEIDEQKRYLEDLEDTIVINDLIVRFKIKNIVLFKNFVNYILRSNSRVFSVKSIHDYLKQENESCSINTISNYINYLEEAYIIESVNEYSTKVKRELKFYKKIYNADVALNSIRCMNNRFDLSHNLENIVYLELLYMGYSLRVYNNNGREIDFYAVKDNKEYLIQVALSIAEEKAYEREFELFNKLDNRISKIIITNDQIDYSTSTVRHIKLKDFLLLNDLSTL